MTDNRKTISMLKTLKEEIELNSYNFVLGESISRQAPSVTPKEKTAVWVGIDQEPHEVYECNACGWLLYDEDRTDFKYCPNCGARMQEVEENG